VKERKGLGGGRERGGGGSGRGGRWRRKEGTKKEVEMEGLKEGEEKKGWKRRST